MSTPVLRKLQQAHNKLQSGDIAEAASICERVLRSSPHNVDALLLLGTSRLLDNRIHDAAALFERAVSVAGNHGPALEQLGLARLMLEEYEAAESALRRAAAVRGAPASVRMRLGLALLHQGKIAEAVIELEHAAELNPADLDTRLNLGQAYARAGNWASAAREFERVLFTAPKHADALYNLGVVRSEQADLGRARVYFAQAVACAPDHLDAREQLAATCMALGRFSEAMAQLRQVIEHRPSNGSAFTALANACFQCGELEEALLMATRARDLEPSSSDAYSLLAQMHHVRGALDSAVEVLEDGLARTGANVLLGALVHLLHRLCDWARWRSAWQRMATELEHASDLGSPFWLLHEATSAHQQLAYTRRWAAERFAKPSTVQAPKPAPAKHDARRMRIGYFSADFFQHPVAALLVETLELHDRERFEIFAYSYGPDDGSVMRTRLQHAVEHFVDVAWDPDDIVVSRMRADELDILVDLKGYTVGDRLGVMAQRPCEIQMTWLGYPGTTGASFIDYLIADPFLIPEGSESAYSERILRLPHCYQPNDRKRPVGAALTRREYGLPDDAFVFCCFNQTVKITPEVFACWMRLLKAIPDSVLWLLHDNQRATDNLMSAARDQGVAADRIHIAPRLPVDQHLARYSIADLALDTHPYTSHTTASDSLWMGCPLVALCGETFAARVSGSILASAQLSELITYTLDDYEQLVQRLATSKQLMSNVRQRLVTAREAGALFDSNRFVRDLEQLYSTVVRRGEDRTAA
jgi:predicted O-linked N-acetylglucosamine transferase (SPINDLY family)